MGKYKEILVVFVTLVIFISSVCHVSADYVAITVQTDKQIYNVGQTVNINGTVIFNGAPLTNALVAIQVNDRTLPILYRTVNTGQDPSGPFDIEMLNAFLGDFNKNPITNAKTGSSYWIWLVYYNSKTYPIHAALSFTIVDYNNCPIAALMVSVGDVPTGGPWYTGYQWTVPTDAPLGTAKIYGNAFTDYPSNSGTSYSPEKSSTFNIVSTLSTSGFYGSSLDQITQTEGVYQLNFTIPKKDARLGNYTVYSTAAKWDLKDKDETIFTVVLLGDVNGDNFVNAKDAVLLGAAFASQQGDPNYNPNADLNDDGFCNAKDAIIIGANFGNNGR